MYLKSFVSRKNEIENKIKTYIGPKRHHRRLLGLLFSSPWSHPVGQALSHTHRPHKQLLAAVVGVLRHRRALVGLGRVLSRSSSFVPSLSLVVPCLPFLPWSSLVIVIPSRTSSPSQLHPVFTPCGVAVVSSTPRAAARGGGSRFSSSSMALVNTLKSSLVKK
jgi:hypothetical protein